MVRDLIEDIKSGREFVYRITVTPETARYLLETTQRENNRRVTTSRVDRYAKEMLSKGWRYNGQGLGWSRSGRLVDGQHRLMACIKAKTPFDTRVIGGLPEDAFTTVDVGLNRKFSHILQIEGHRNATALASLVILIYRTEHNDLFSPRYDTPNHSNLLSVLEKYPKLQDSIRESECLCRARILGRTIGAFFHHCAAIAGRHALATEFMTSLAAGTDLKGDSPIYHLREYIHDLQRLSTLGRGVGLQNLIMPYCLAWNLYVAERRIVRFKQTLGTFAKNPRNPWPYDTNGKQKTL